MSQPKSSSATQPSRVRAAAGRVRAPAARKARQATGSDPVLARYYARRLGTRDILFLFVPGIFASLAPLLYGLWRADYAYARYGPVAAEHWSRPWYNMAIAATAIFLLLGLYRLKLSLISVKVYRRGIFIRTGFRPARMFEWGNFQGLTCSAIHEHFFGWPVRNTYQARLILPSGKSLELPRSLRNLPELISRLKANLYPRLLPDLQADFQRGEWLAFGPIAIQVGGLRLESREFSWRQVKYIDVRDGKLRIEFNDRPDDTIAVSQIPNLELVLQLIDQGIS